MKKKIFAILAIVAIISSIFASCSSSKDNQITSTTLDNYDQHADEYILEDRDVTNENGEVVTDEHGNKVTEKVVVKVTNSESKSSNNNSNGTIEIGNLTTEREETSETTTIPSVDNTTSPVITTLPSDKNEVPLTTDTGKEVDFSAQDQQILKQMLEVPYLYESSYENTEGVPINIASHAAIWLMQREGLSTNTFPEGNVVLNLFKYFGQTVVNYSNRCNNESSNNNIMFVNEKVPGQDKYNKLFIITNVEQKTHSISIDHIEDLGNNNYYKVVANVKGVKGKSKVNAVVQRNKLDASLGFSIKALNWQ